MIPPAFYFSEIFDRVNSIINEVAQVYKQHRKFVCIYSISTRNTIQLQGKYLNPVINVKDLVTKKGQNIFGKLPKNT